MTSTKALVGIAAIAIAAAVLVAGNAALRRSDVDPVSPEAPAVPVADAQFVIDAPRPARPPKVPCIPCSHPKTEPSSTSAPLPAVAPSTGWRHRDPLIYQVTGRDLSWEAPTGDAEWIVGEMKRSARLVQAWGEGTATGEADNPVSLPFSLPVQASRASMQGTVDRVLNVARWLEAHRGAHVRRGSEVAGFAVVASDGRLVYLRPEPRQAFFDDILVVTSPAGGITSIEAVWGDPDEQRYQRVVLQF